MKIEPTVEMNTNQSTDKEIFIPSQEKKKISKVIISITVLLMLIAIVVYIAHYINSQPEQIQFGDISMKIPGNMEQVTGEDFNDIFTGMGTDDADSKMAYLSNPSWAEQTGKFVYGISYTGFNDIDIDTVLYYLEKEGATLPVTNNYYIGNIDTRISEIQLTDELEGYTEHAASFMKNNAYYMISYISKEDNHEENFYKIIDTIY